MHRADPTKPPTVSANREFWYSVLNIFPFIFLPLVALIGVLCSIVMPYLTGVRP
jgi:hypothetical protein